MEVIIPGDKIRTEADFHREIKLLLRFPEYYGNNLDALWDCISSDIELPLTLIWRDFEKCEACLGDFAMQALAVFKCAEKETKRFKITIN